MPNLKDSLEASEVCWLFNRQVGKNVGLEVTQPDKYSLKALWHVTVINCKHASYSIECHAGHPKLRIRMYGGEMTQGKLD